MNKYNTIFLSKTNKMSSGYLELIVGPMFSGKTTRLVELYNEYKNTLSFCVINFEKDKRYSEDKLSTHDKLMIPCIFTSEIKSLYENENLLKADVILINEGQFFCDIFESVMYLVETKNKRVYVCGLDGDFERKKFGNILDLIPYSDSVIKLKSNCNNCNEPAIFSHRLTDENEQVVIGSNNYVPLCRKCYTFYKNL